MKKNYQVQLQMGEHYLTKNRLGQIDHTSKLKSSAFTITEVGYWLGEMAHEDDISNFVKNNTKLKFVNKETFSIQDKILFRFPKLDLPRQKVDLLKEKYNVKVIRDYNKADVHIVSDKLFENLIKTDWYRTPCPFENFVAILQDLKKKDLLSEECITMLKKEIEDNDLSNSMIHVNIPYYNSRNNNASQAQLIEQGEKIVQRHMANNNGRGSEQSSSMTIKSEDVDAFLKLESTNIEIMYDTDVIDIIDEELAIIDNTEYDTILKMTESSDIENRSLVLEMLANCNISKSFDIVSGIFFWQYNWLKDTSNWNTINVKALRKKMTKYSGGPQTSAIWTYNHYINLLVADNKLTKFAVDRTREKLYNNVLGSLVGSHADVFHVPLESLVIKNSLIEKIINHD